MENFENYLIIGVGISVILEVAKKYFGGVTSLKGKLFIIGLSLLTGGAYYYLINNESLYLTVISILASASMAYTLIIKSVSERLSDK